MRVDELSGVLDDAFSHAGSLDRDELLRVLEAHGVDARLRAALEQRLPSGVRFRDADAVWPHVPEAVRSRGEGRLHQIGEVAERVGLSLRTVRYYEEVGLVRPSARSDGGFRLYSDADVRRLVRVKRMKALGLSVEESCELLALLDAAEGAAELSDDELASTLAKLELAAQRGDDRIRRLERDLDGARRLRIDLSEHLGHCRAAHAARGSA